MKITVLVSGGWGTALAMILYKNGHLVYAGSKYVSLASCTAAAALIACSWGFYWKDLGIALAGTLVGLLALYMHRENLARLAKGTERKTYLRKDKK